MSVRHTVASEQCTAKSKATGRRCERRVRGGGVCIMHGGKAPQVRAKRIERLAVAEQIERTPRRHPGSVLLDATHTMDVLAQRAREAAGGKMTPRQLRELVASTERAAAVARAALSAQAEQLAGEATAALAKQVDRGLSLFMGRVGLSHVPSAEEALVDACRVASGERTFGDALFAGAEERYDRISEELGGDVTGVMDHLVLAIGLDPHDPWVASVIADALRSFGESGPGALVPTKAPRSWWHQLARRAATELGLADPTMLPSVEVLPPIARRALESGA